MVRKQRLFAQLTKSRPGGNEGRKGKNMKIMSFVFNDTAPTETYTITVRKHTESEIINEYGFPYSIRIANANPKAFDLNNHVYLYDAWQTAYKRLFELSEVYKDIKPLIMEGVDGETGACI